jgi:Transposase, Mutator family
MEIPECPIAAHAGSKVVRGGWYGKPPHRRQRWWCRPANGDTKHRFTPVLTRQGEPHPFCVECSTGLEPWEGQAGAREYRFAAREVGEALVSVANGSSYRVAAEIARHKAGRVPPPRPRKRRSQSNEGQLVANWVDVCGEFVCAEQLPACWPDTVAVDSQNFRVKSGPRTGLGFHVLAAVGRDRGEPGWWAPAPRVWRLEPFAHKDQAAWEAFLGALQGAPRVIVSDADNALALAVKSVFGGVEHRLCEWHLARKLRQHLPDEILADRWHPITLALPQAFHSLEAWDRLENAIEAERACGQHRPLALAVKWMHAYGQIAAAQIPTRDPRGINSTGPVEQTLREIDRRIGDRIGSYTNRARLSKLLDLMTLDLQGKADARDWADRLRERLYLAGGRPKNQRPHDDRKGVHSLFL